MILSKKEILEEITKGHIIQQYGPDVPDEIVLQRKQLVKNQSVDVRLGRYIWEFASDKQILIDLNYGEFECLPGYFYIAHTEEFIGTYNCNIVPTFKLKSTAGREGIMHTLAGHGDCGFFGRWAMEFTVAKPVTLERYVKIAQIYFTQTTSRENYSEDTGSYQNTTSLNEMVTKWQPEDLLSAGLRI